MTRLSVNNFGPIVSSGWIDIKKVVVFIGNQGSGKSTVAKLLSTFLWMEKVLTRGDFKEGEFTAAKFKKVYCAYHRTENYFKNGLTEIIYEGESYRFLYKDNNLKITKRQNALNTYALPQIMYVPAERNLVSVLESSRFTKDLPDALITFMTEYNNAKEKQQMSSYSLPVNNAEYEYNRQTKKVYVKGKGYRVYLSEASSGFQSVVPLFIVSQYLANSVANQAGSATKMSSDEAARFEAEVSSIWNNDDLTQEQRRLALSALSSRFNKSAFINIVEEPEQNLFPDSQMEVLNSLLTFNNYLVPNKLILTTHSPYMINFLTIAIKTGMLEKSCHTDDARMRLDEIYPIRAAVNSEDIAIYQFHEDNGTVSLLEMYDGLPSDDNFLNNVLSDSNDKFSRLIELEDEL